MTWWMIIWWMKKPWLACGACPGQNPKNATQRDGSDVTHCDSNKSNITLPGLPKFFKGNLCARGRFFEVVIDRIFDNSGWPFSSGKVHSLFVLCLSQLIPPSLISFLLVDIFLPHLQPL